MERVSSAMFLLTSCLSKRLSAPLLKADVWGYDSRKKRVPTALGSARPLVARDEIVEASFQLLQGGKTGEGRARWQPRINPAKTGTHQE